MSFASTTEFGNAASQMQKMWFDSWGQMVKSTVSSESFAAASGAYMDWTLSTQKMVAEMSGQVMETLDMPRRSDLARLAAQVQSVETRLLDQEEANEDIRSLLVALNNKLDRLAAAKPAAPVAVPPTPPVVANNKPVTAGVMKEAVSQAATDIKVTKAAPRPSDETTAGQVNQSKAPRAARKNAKKGGK